MEYRVDDLGLAWGSRSIYANDRILKAIVLRSNGHVGNAFHELHYR